MTYLLTHFGETSSGIGALGVDGKALLIQLVTFALAYVVLRRYAFGPILKVLQERRETIEKGVSLGEQMQKDKAKLETTVAENLQAARKEADGIIASAYDTAKLVVREGEEKARQKAEAILKEADARIVTDTARARHKLENDLIGLISEATEAIIGEKVDDKKDAQLIQSALKGSK